MTDSRVGTVLVSKYRLDEELGRGGMGAVYRAHHLLVRKDFAVKLVKSELAEQKKVAQRFLLEAQAAGRIGHPGILDVYDFGEDEDGCPFMVMELLRGEPLSALVARGPLGVDEACWIACEVLDVLSAAHEAGVVHRDVKPQNVFLVATGEGQRKVKLLDFGIAKFREADGGSITRSGEIIGSPLYMSPEQAKGQSDVDARADVWSVGAMLFEMLTGKAAHTASSAVAVLAKILTEVPPPPSRAREGLPATLDAAVLKAMTIDRDARFASAREMQDALREVRRELGTSETAPAFPTPPPPKATVRTGDDRVDQVGVATSTIASTSPSRDESGSREPAMEAALTNHEARRSRARPAAMVVAAAVLLAAAALPLIRPWSKDAPAPAADASPPTSSLAAVAPVETASAVVEASAPAVDASPEVAVDASLAAPRARAAADAGPPTATISRPSCPPAEVLSSGHCCPRGLVWQSGRCERPLATSF